MPLAQCRPRAPPVQTVDAVKAFASWAILTLWLGGAARPLAHHVTLAMCIPELPRARPVTTDFATAVPVELNTMAFLGAQHRRVLNAPALVLQM